MLIEPSKNLVEARHCCVSGVLAVESMTSTTRRLGWMPIGTALAAMTVALSPIYSARNDRWVEPARLSQRTLQILEHLNKR